MGKSSFNAKRNSKEETATLLRKKDLKRAINDLRSDKKKKSKFDKLGKETKLKILGLCHRDPQIGNKLRPTAAGRMSNTQQLLQHLNRSVLKHDWPAVATCIDFLLNLNGKLMPVIWKALFLILFNHQDSSPERLDMVLTSCLGLKTESDKIDYLKGILSLPQEFNKLHSNDIYVNTKTGL